MTDQATILRQLIQQRRSSPQPSPPSHRMARSLAVTSGKGGVGKSNLALNLGIALAQHGARVCLLDASLGLSNLDLLCGLNGYWNLSHVLTGARNLNQIILDGPAGVHLIPGASGLADVADCPEPAQQNILTQVAQLEQNHDFLIVDTGPGIHRPVRSFVEVCDYVLVVTTPEPTAIADAYATVKVLAGRGGLAMHLLVNQATSAQQARQIFERLKQTSQIFVRREIDYAGSVPFDRSVPNAVARRRPFLIEFPDCPASLALRRLAARLRGLPGQTKESPPFFARLWNHLRRRAA